MRKQNYVLDSCGTFLKIKTISDVNGFTKSCLLLVVDNSLCYPAG